MIALVNRLLCWLMGVDLCDLHILFTNSLVEDNSGCPNQQMSRSDQPVEISHEDLHLGDTKHGNNQGNRNCNGSQNAKPLGEYGNNTRAQKCKSDEYTKEHMK